MMYGDHQLEISVFHQLCQLNFGSVHKRQGAYKHQGATAYSKPINLGETIM